MSSHLRRVRLNSSSCAGSNSTRNHTKMSTKTIMKISNNMRRSHTKSFSGSVTKTEVGGAEENKDGNEVGLAETVPEEDPQVEKMMRTFKRSCNIQNAKMGGGKNAKRHQRKNKAQKHASVKHAGDGHGLQWGKPGDEISETSCSHGDPNYNSDESPFDETESIVYVVSIDEFQKLFDDWIDDYLNHGNVNEVTDLLLEFNPNQDHLLRIPFFVMNKALELKPKQHEQLSLLISAVCVNFWYSSHLIQRAFNMVILEDLKEMVIDLGDAPEMVAKFVARAIADDVLPPNFVTNHKNGVSDDEHASRVFKKANALLNQPHSYAHLDVVWVGYTGLKIDRSGQQPCKRLIKAIRALLEEYLDALDTLEVFRLLRELDVPYFLHELVYQAFILAFDFKRLGERSKLAELLGLLYERGILSVQSIEIGVQRIYKDINEILVDTPNVFLLLEQFSMMGKTNGWMSPKLVNQLPRMKRNRFISECQPSQSRKG